MGAVADLIRDKLETAFSPEQLVVLDESDKHAGHAGTREGGESHFTITIRSTAFTGVPRLQRQRRVYGVLAEELAGPVHALSVRALAPDESLT